MTTGRRTLQRGVWVALLAVAFQVLSPVWAMARLSPAFDWGAICATRDGTDHVPPPDPLPTTHDHACSLCPVCAATQAFLPPDIPRLPIPVRPITLVRFDTRGGLPHGAALPRARARAPPLLFRTEISAAQPRFM